VKTTNPANVEAHAERIASLTGRPAVAGARLVQGRGGPRSRSREPEGREALAAVTRAVEATSLRSRACASVVYVGTLGVAEDGVEFVVNGLHSDPRELLAELEAAAWCGALSRPRRRGPGGR